MDKRKMKKKLRELYFDSDNYYKCYTDNGEDCDCEYFVDDAMEDFEYIMTEYGYIDGFLSGCVEKWNNNYCIDDLTIMSLEEVIENIKDTNRLIISFEEDSEEIIVENYHHDGVDIFRLKPLEMMSKQELYEIAKKINNDLYEQYREPISTYTKDGLISFIKENI